MSIQLGAYTFPENTTATVEKHEEIGGKEGRTVRIKGLITAHGDLPAIEAELDAMLAAASEHNPDTPLLLRPDRRLWVRRSSFERQIQRAEMIGAFALVLKADDPAEESVAEHSEVWNVTQSGATLALGTVGNQHTTPGFSITATGNLSNPAISDGARTLTYKGIVGDGETLTFDAENRRVLLEGEDRTWHSEGEFPRIASGGTTLIYTDAFISSHTADITVTYRDKWW